MTDLLVAPCDMKAARYAVTHWHYSRRAPVGKVVSHGVWEGGSFIGAVLYSWGANHNLSKQFGLDMVEVVELVRVALTTHQAPVSSIVSRSVALLREANPGLRVVVSFADPHQGHHGGIYQAMNWLYLGETDPKRELVDAKGHTMNRRAYTGSNYGSPKLAIPPGASWVQVPGKHRYVLPLDRAMRRALTRRAQAYPPR